jgi:outer membrane protein assembly factor BamE (lipoprotein component of BamABCDE complex)
MLIRMKKAVVLLLTALLCSCVTGEQVATLDPGMSKERVVRIMGRPDGFQTRGDFTLFKYTNRLIHGWSWDRTDYTIIFDASDKLIEYGPGEVRERNVGGIHTVFIYQM